MRGCYLILNDNKIHTGNDLDLVQETKTITKPDIITYTVSVPGRNGLLDLSEGLTGSMNYGNRKITLGYFGTRTRSELLELDSKFNKYHGKYIKIIDDDTPDYYYKGRAIVSSTITGNYIKINITIDAYPFRIKTESTVIKQTISDTGIFTINNPGVAIPFTITTTAAFKISNGEIEISLSEAGTYTISGFIVENGVNNFTFTGSGNVEFKYNEEVI